MLPLSASLKELSLIRPSWVRLLFFKKYQGQRTISDCPECTTSRTPNDRKFHKSNAEVLQQVHTEGKKWMEAMISTQRPSPSCLRFGKIVGVSKN